QVDLKAARAAVADHGESLLSGLFTLTIPPKQMQPIFVGVAALGLLLVAGYGYRAVPNEAPRTNGDASVTAARESKASLKTVARTIDKRVVLTVPLPPAAPIIRASSDNPSPGTPHHSPAVLTSLSGGEKVRREDIAAIVLPTLQPPQPAIKHQESDEDRKVLQAVQVSTLSATQSAALEVDHKRSILVKYGDTLEKLALRYLGSRYALNTLIDANPQIADINKIYPGQKVYLAATGNPGGSSATAARLASQPSASYPNDASRTDDSNGPDATSALGSENR
ncbi:MAG: LysM peptidoglycan-binding domain-containing protein, partial [Candidatus Binataceae bacterium]